MLESKGMRWLKKTPLLLFLLTAFLLGFLLRGRLEETQKPPPTAPNPTSADNATTAAPTKTTSPPNWPITAKVARVIDGDTVVLGNGEKIRYEAVDAPEKYEHWGEEAKKLNTELTLDKTVRLESGRDERDIYGRLLAYVWVGDLLVNEKLIERGYAKIIRYPKEGEYRYQERLEKAEEWARDHSLGVWLDLWLKR